MVISGHARPYNFVDSFLVAWSVNIVNVMRLCSPRLYIDYLPTCVTEYAVLLVN
jgi:hypothetical protein